LFGIQACSRTSEQNDSNNVLAVSDI